jgi:hypothetical protein
MNRRATRNVKRIPHHLTTCSGFSTFPLLNSLGGIASRSRSRSALTLHSSTASDSHVGSSVAAALHYQHPRSVFLPTMPKASAVQPAVRQSSQLKALQPRNGSFEEELASWLWLYELFNTEDEAVNGIVRMYLLRHPECNPSGFDYYPADYASHLTTTEHHRHYNTWYQVRSIFDSKPAIYLPNCLSV